MIRRAVSISLMGICLAVWARSARAQNGPDNDPDAAPGYVNSYFHHSSVDSVNLYNGQLTIPIALGPSYPIGPNLKFQAVMSYNSRVTDYGRPQSQETDFTYVVVAGDPALGIGWNFTLGAIKFCKQGADGGVCYFGPDGSQHIFGAMPLQGYAKPLDGTQLLLHDSGNGVTAGPYEMWDGDGNHYSFHHQVAGFDDSRTDYVHDFGVGRDGWYLTSVNDPFNNSYSASYFSGIANACWTYPAPACNARLDMICPAIAPSWIPQTVTLPGGATIDIGQVGGQITSMSFPVFANDTAGRATWTIHYGPDEPFLRLCNGVPTQETVNLKEITAISLPSDIPGSPSYRFSYSTCAPGYLSQMILPTGAQIDYSYGRYAFYHGRLGAIEPGCQVSLPPPSATVEISSAYCDEDIGPQKPTLDIPGGCSPDADIRWLDHETGVVRRQETIPRPAPDGTTQDLFATTDYTQYAFPYGEQGTSPTATCDALGRCGTQTLTIVEFPADVDGRRAAKGVLFYAGPRNAGSSTHAGDRTGADVEERIFDGNPNPSSVCPNCFPVCGGANDYPFCANHAARVIQRAYDYDFPSAEIYNRRLLSETTYHQAPQANGQCPGCKYHAVTFSPGEASSPGHWESNGRHFDTEAHSGNLGGDSRTITTAWMPVHWTAGPPAEGFAFPNLYNHRIESDASLVKDQYFEFDSATGFLNCTFQHDALRQRVFFTRRYSAPDGSASQDFSATATPFPSPPSIGQCTAFYPASQPPVPSGPAVGTNGDAFGKIYTSQNGQLTSARWINGNGSAGWYVKNLVRDSTTGWIRFASDTAGLWTSYTYDSVGRVTDIAPPDETDTVVRYPSATRTTAARTAGIGLSTYEQYDYDGLGRLIRERKLMPGSRYAKRFHAFDGAGNAYFESDWVADETSETLSLDLATSCASSYTTSRPSAAPGAYSFCFDPFGRPRQVAGSNFSSLTAIDRTDGSTRYSDTREATTTSCINGPLLTSGACGSGGFNAVTTEVKDAFGRLTSVTEPDGAMTNYTYDLNDKLTRVVQSGLPDRTFTYDPAGVLRSEFTPEKGAVSYDDYGSLGNLRRETESDGLVRRNCYDFAGRLTEIRTSEDGAAPLCAYENQGTPAGRLYVSNGYDTGAGYSLGKLASRTATNYNVSPYPTVSDFYSYAGAGGRLSEEQTQVAGSQGLTVTQGWQYNGLGLLAHHHHARTTGTSPFVVSLGYDAGQPVAEYVNGIPMVTGIAYQPSGALASYATGIGNGHNVATTILPDGSLPRPSSIATAGATANFSTGAYGYDGAGNVRLMGADSFGYDSRSRLISAALSGAGSQAYSYDRFGNLLAKGGNTFCTGTCPNNQISGASYLRGNLTSYAGQAFSWDGLDRMASSSQGSLNWSYLYDGGDERAAKIPPTGNWTFTIRDESKRVASEYSGATAARDNVFLGNQLVLSYANAAVGGNGSVWTFYASDHLGTPRLVTDVAGTAIETRRYWPYGDAIPSQSPFEALRFATMEFDSEGGTAPGLLTDRYYDHARSHVGGLGRFLCPDADHGDPQHLSTWARYVYAADNPLKYVDPDGNAVRLPESLQKAILRNAGIRSDVASYLERTGNGLLRAPVDALLSFVLPGSEAEMAFASVPGPRQTGTAGSAMVSRGVTVLGHFPEYLQKAEELGARRFNIPTAIWDSMTPSAQWAANQKFLDRLAARGDVVALSNNVSKIRAGSSLEKEVKYLLEKKNYKVSSDGWRLMPADKFNGQ